MLAATQSPAHAVQLHLWDVVDSSAVLLVQMPYNRIGLIYNVASVGIWTQKDDISGCCELCDTARHAASASKCSTAGNRPMSRGNCSFPPRFCAAALCLTESFGVGNTSTCTTNVWLHYPQINDTARDGCHVSTLCAQAPDRGTRTSKSRSVMASRTRLRHETFNGRVKDVAERA